MHKLASTPITLDCFEMSDYNNLYFIDMKNDLDTNLANIINMLEDLRLLYNQTGDKQYWKELVRWLPQSWLQTRTWTCNYENLLAICSEGQRRNHKLAEWSVDFMNWARALPYAQELIFLDEKANQFVDFFKK